MQKLSINRIFTQETPQLLVRNNREQIIADIVDATNEKNKSTLARAIAVNANALGWTDSELHALLAKRTDPSIRNFTAFVKWSIKVRAKEVIT